MKTHTGQQGRAGEQTGRRESMDVHQREGETRAPSQAGRAVRGGGAGWERQACVGSAGEDVWGGHRHADSKHGKVGVMETRGGENRELRPVTGKREQGDSETEIGREGWEPGELHRGKSRAMCWNCYALESPRKRAVPVLKQLIFLQDAQHTNRK